MRLVLGHLLRRLGRRRGPRPRPAPPPRRLAVEGLEDRQLLSAATIHIPGLPTPIPVSRAPYILFADVNFDGTPDVILSSGRTVQVYLGSADGAYALAFQTTRQPGLKSFALGIGDLNRDGRTDFVTVGRLGSSHRSVVNVLTENRDGSYKASAQVVNDPAALDSLFAHENVQTSVLWRADDHPAAMAPGSAALAGALPERGPRDPEDVDPTADAATPAAPHGTASGGDEVLDHGPATGPTSLSPRVDHSSDTPRPEAGPDGGPLVLRSPDGGRADTAADGAPVDGAAGADRLARLTLDVAPAGDAGPRPPAFTPARRHSAASASADGTADEEGAGLAVPEATLLGLRPGWLARAADGVALLGEARRAVAAPLGEPAEPSSPVGAADAVARRVQLSVRDLGQMLAQALYLGSLKQAGGNNGSVAGLADVPGDTRLLVADLVQRTSEVFARVVQGFFALFLARAAQPGEENGWVAMLLAGQTEEQVLSAFLSTAEFGRRADEMIASGSSDERFLRALYALLLRRAPSDAELGGWLAALPELGRGGVASFLLRSAEFRTLQIASYYEELLQRPAPASEVESWANSPFDLLTIRLFFEARPAQLAAR